MSGASDRRKGDRVKPNLVDARAPPTQQSSDRYKTMGGAFKQRRPSCPEA